MRQAPHARRQHPVRRRPLRMPRRLRVELAARGLLQDRVPDGAHDRDPGDAEDPRPHRAAAARRRRGRLGLGLGLGLRLGVGVGVRVGLRAARRGRRAQERGHRRRRRRLVMRPTWTVNDILTLADDETRHRFLNHNLVYGRPAGADSLREAIAEMQRVPVEEVQIVTGASEALVALMWLAAEPGANVVIPLPGFTTFSALPESLGLETRFYRVRRENGFRIDPDEIKRLADSKTKLILVNSPHNPTGATIGDGEMEALHDFTAERGIQLVSDEVYHPIYHGRQTKSAARLPHATVIADLSKAFSIAGVRTGWMIEKFFQPGFSGSAQSGRESSNSRCSLITRSRRGSVTRHALHRIPGCLVSQHLHARGESETCPQPTAMLLPAATRSWPQKPARLLYRLSRRPLRPLQKRSGLGLLQIAAGQDGRANSQGNHGWKWKDVDLTADDTLPPAK